MSHHINAFLVQWKLQRLKRREGITDIGLIPLIFGGSHHTGSSRKSDYLMTQYLAGDSMLMIPTCETINIACYMISSFTFAFGLLFAANTSTIFS